MTSNAVQRMIDSMTGDEVRSHLRFLLTAAETAQGAHLDDLLAQYNACLAARPQPSAAQLTQWGPSFH